MAELLNFVHHLGLLFRNRGQPTKSTSWPERCVKIIFQSHYYFPRYGHMKILQIWLKMPIPAPIFAFWGVLTPKHYFSSSRPSKGTSLGEFASFKVYIAKIRPPIFAVGDDKKKKERKGKVHKVTSRLYFTNINVKKLPF